LERSGILHQSGQRHKDAGASDPVARWHPQGVSIAEVRGVKDDRMDVRIFFCSNAEMPP
jgi:hypothetical protein